MKRKPRKLVLTRETLRTLEDRSLRPVGGGAHETDGTECSTWCILPTNIWYACG